MGMMGMEYDALVKGSAEWRSLAKLMTTTASDLGSTTTSALPPRVQRAGKSFLTRWDGFARESAAIADGFAGALTATQDDTMRAGDAVDRRFSDLDGRLGPAR